MSKPVNNDFMPMELKRMYNDGCYLSKDEQKSLVTEYKEHRLARFHYMNAACSNRIDETHIAPIEWTYFYSYTTQLCVVQRVSDNTIQCAYNAADEMTTPICFRERFNTKRDHAHDWLEAEQIGSADKLFLLNIRADWASFGPTTTRQLLRFITEACNVFVDKKSLLTAQEQYEKTKKPYVMVTTSHHAVIFPMSSSYVSIVFKEV